MIRSIAPIALALLAAAPATAQLVGRMTPAGCISLAKGASRVTATGRLALRTFPGSPGFASVARGDEVERVFIISLPRPACIDDRGELADPKQRFSTVQVYADRALERRLRASVGRRVSVTGDGMPANTGHHHAPLVLTATRVLPH